MSPNINPPTIHGDFDPRFQSVRDSFQQNFQLDRELGAALAVYHNGTKVIDLWAGHQDKNKTKPWEENTITCLMSVTKAIAAIAVLSLADQGLITLDEPIASYWPEFGQNGKEKITVRHWLANFAGVPYLDAAAKDSLFDEAALFKAMENQAPLWPPGTVPCYHSFTYGVVCQKLIHLIKGKSLGQYLREDLLKPFDIDIYLGLRPEEIERCAEVFLEDNIPSIVGMQDPDSLLGKAWHPATINEAFFASNDFQRSEMSSSNGHSTARDLAKLYNALLNPDAKLGKTLLSQATLTDAMIEQWDAVEEITHRHFRYSTGFMLNNPYFQLGSNPNNFGHPGLGGLIGYADPDNNIAFAYCCNRIKAVDRMDPSNLDIIDALYRSL